MKHFSLRKLFLGFGALALFILAWKLVTDAKLVSPIFFPGPERTYAALVKGLAGGAMLSQTLETVRRMLLGWLLASFVGVFLGALIGVSRRARAFIAPTLELLRPLPASAMIPIAIAEMEGHQQWLQGAPGTEDDPQAQHHLAHAGRPLRNRPANSACVRWSCVWVWCSARAARCCRC